MIKIDNVKKSFFYGNMQTEILHGINLQIEDEEILAIMGKSGSGKSTLLNIIGGLIEPSLGEVDINEIVFSKLEEEKKAIVRNKNIGFVFQRFHLLPDLTAIDNVMLPLQYNKDISQKEGIKKAKALLEKLGLKERIHYRPNYMSGGEQQRVAIARAVINNPKIILADEPTGSLDSKMSMEIMSILLAIVKEEKMTLVIVTHDPNVAKVADKIIFLKDGKITDYNYVI